jgi:hypothetical protein
MMRTLLVLAVVAATVSPLLVSSNDSRLGLPRSGRSKTAPDAAFGSVALSSANYSVISESIGSGGAPAQSASYSMNASAIGEFGAGGSASIASANYSDEVGYVGQLGGLQGPITAISRKTHGAAGDFDIDLPFSGSVGIECRTGGASGDYKLVVTFAESVTVSSASVASGTGTVPPGGASAGGNQITVNLTGVANAQTIFVTLSGVSDGPNTADVSVAMGVLIGDTTANGAVNSSDIAQTQSQSGQPVTANNFREDVTVNGAINSSDIGLVQSKSGTALPTPP